MNFCFENKFFFHKTIDSNLKEQIQEVKSLLQEVEVKNLNFSNQESSGDWNNAIKWNEKSYFSENDELRATLRSQNLYSVPNGKFRAYWQDRVTDSISKRKFFRLLLHFDIKYSL